MRRTGTPGWGRASREGTMKLAVPKGVTVNSIVSEVSGVWAFHSETQHLGFSGNRSRPQTLERIPLSLLPPDP